MQMYNHDATTMCDQLPHAKALSNEHWAASSGSLIELHSNTKLKLAKKFLFLLYDI